MNLLRKLRDARDDVSCVSCRCFFVMEVLSVAGAKKHVSNHGCNRGGKHETLPSTVTVPQKIHRNDHGDDTRITTTYQYDGKDRTC